MDARELIKKYEKVSNTETLIFEYFTRTNVDVVVYLLERIKRSAISYRAAKKIFLNAKKVYSYKEFYEKWDDAKLLIKPKRRDFDEKFDLSFYLFRGGRVFYIVADFYYVGNNEAVFNLNSNHVSHGTPRLIMFSGFEQDYKNHIQRNSWMFKSHHYHPDYFDTMALGFEGEKVFFGADSQALPNFPEEWK